jgi:hypothetical protein
VRRGLIDLLGVIDDGPSLDLSLDFLPGLNQVRWWRLWSRNPVDVDGRMDDPLGKIGLYHQRGRDRRGMAGSDQEQDSRMEFAIGVCRDWSVGRHYRTPSL